LAIAQASTRSRTWIRAPRRHRRVTRPARRGIPGSSRLMLAATAESIATLKVATMPATTQHRA
jgi:hypothetical protein